MIHAPIFRDIGQPNTGLTPHVEEQARLAMLRVDRATSRQPRLPQIKPEGGAVSKQESNAEMVLRARRHILTAISAGYGSPVAISDVLRRDHWGTIRHCRWLADQGLVRETKEGFVAGNGAKRQRMAFVITDAGRAWLEAQG